jgi:hypothetical protein
MNPADASSPTTFVKWFREIANSCAICSVVKRASGLPARRISVRNPKSVKDVKRM